MSARRRSLGRMSHRLAVMNLVRAADGRGGTSRADTVAAVIRARIETISKIEANTYAQRQERVTHQAMVRKNAAVVHGVTCYWIDRGAAAPAIGDAQVSDATALYVVAVEDADPDKRPGEFMRVLLREGGNL